MLPEILQERIYKLIENERLKNLTSSSQSLTNRYRNNANSSQYMETEGHKLSYLLTRMPATYAAVKKVLLETSTRFPDSNLHSFLDLGTGPGTGMWAVREVFPQIDKFTLIEKDSSLISIGKKLSLGKEKWIQSDLEKAEAFDPHELVLLAYTLGELKNEEKMIKKAWQGTQKVLIVIEPGTPIGFSRLKKIRQVLIHQGAHLVAPCPHIFECPIQEKDWCHFSVRLSRTSLHRQIKGGSLGYEDEKFFYLVFSKKSSFSRCHERILRHPQKYPGYVELTVCTQEGIEKKIFSKKEKEKYKSARKAEWGEAFHQTNK